MSETCSIISDDIGLNTMSCFLGQSPGPEVPGGQDIVLPCPPGSSYPVTGAPGLALASVGSQCM